MRTWISGGIAVLFCAFVASADETTTGAPLEITVSGAGAYNPQMVAKLGFAPRRAAFSSKINTARCYGNATWNTMTMSDKAGYIEDTVRALLALHQNPNDPNDPSYRFSYRVLVCKAFNESGFETQAASGASSAAGLAQVTDGTGKDLFTRYQFRSAIAGYEHISDYATFKKKMAAEPGLQLELGLAVMEMKRKDYGLDVDSVVPFLTRYYGSQDGIANQIYAEGIFNCASCVKDNGGTYPLSCLCQAKLNDPKCRNTEVVARPKCE